MTGLLAVPALAMADGIGLIALLVFAVAGFCGLASLIVGIIALVRIGASDGKLRGKGFAIAAIILGVLTMLGTPIIAAIAVPTLLASSGPDEVTITTDVARKKPPAGDEKKKVDIFENPGETK